MADLMDRSTLEVLDTLTIARYSEPTSVEFPKSGIYFYMDNEDHAVLSLWKNISFFSFDNDKITLNKTYSLSK